MANPPRKTNYTQGHSAITVASHAARTAASDAAFLLPHLQPADRVLDVGCGPGTITAGLGAHVGPRGSVVGVDLSAAVLEAAEAHLDALAAQATGEEGTAPPPRNVTFQQCDILSPTGLPFPDAAFDVVFASQLFSHIPPGPCDDDDDAPLRALAEMRRVLRPGGLLATRDAAAQHFWPERLDLAALLTANTLRGFGRADWPGPTMPALYRRAGFDVDGDGRVKVGCGTTSYADRAGRRWWADRLVGRLRPGEVTRASWTAAGVGEGEIERCVQRLGEWAETEDAWYVILHSEILAWK